MDMDARMRSHIDCMQTVKHHDGWCSALQQLRQQRLSELLTGQWALPMGAWHACGVAASVPAAARRQQPKLAAGAVAVIIIIITPSPCAALAKGTACMHAAPRRRVSGRVNMLASITHACMHACHRACSRHACAQAGMPKSTGPRTTRPG